MDRAKKQQNQMADNCGCEFFHKHCIKNHRNIMEPNVPSKAEQSHPQVSMGLSVGNPWVEVTCRSQFMSHMSCGRLTEYPSQVLAISIGIFVYLSI